MSKPLKNIEKVLLAVAVLVAIGLVTLGVMKKNRAKSEFNNAPPPVGKGETSVPGSEEVSKASNSLQSNRVLRTATVPNDALPTGEREVDLFVGVPLFANRANPNEPFDPVNSPAIHPPIDNLWWLKYRVSPNFADSPQRDPDSDGFSNLEEFEGGTDPMDSKDTPPLIAKLSYVGDDSVEWLVDFGTEINGKWMPKYESLVDGKVLKNRVKFENGIAPGGQFFAEDPAKDRFKFIDFEERMVHNESLNIDEAKRFAIFEDQKENKKGLKYEIPNRYPRADTRKFIHFDRTAVLKLLALGMDGSEFKVEERTRFSLPPGGKKEDYYLKEVTPERIIVEFERDGVTKEVTIPKGGLPQIDPGR